MSEEQATQAVVSETEVPAQQVTEATSARNDDDIDALLAQFESSASKPSEPAKPATAATAASDPGIAAAEVLAARDEVRQDRFKRDMNDTIEKVRGDLPADFYDNTFMRAWIDARAESDPRLARAWLDRHDNPQRFKQVLGALNKEFTKKYGRIPDRQATEDRAAVTAAVRGSSTKAPEGGAPNYAGMSDVELAREWDRFGA